MRGILIVIMALMLVGTLASTETIIVAQGVETETNILTSSEEETVIELNFGSFYREALNIDNRIYYKLMLDGEPFLTEKDAPQMPYVNRSIIIPDRAETELVLLDSKYIDIEMDIAPSKGDIYRNQNPDDIQLQLGTVYQKDEYYPGKLTELSKPFILRDFRGQTVTFYPFQYNPIEGSVRVYTSMTVAVRTVGESDINIRERTREYISREFADIYENLFLNYSNASVRYPVLDEAGRKIVICYDAYMDAIQPYVDWKNEKGIPTEVYPVSVVGSTPTEIIQFIRDHYNLDDRLTFVQFVGNGSQIPTYRSRGGAADPIYSLIAGDDDYPDVFIGRFSANNVAQVETQVERSIHYERDINTDAEWLTRATGIASSEGSNPSDIQHMNAIRTVMLDYGYSPVDQIYPPHATITRVTDAVEEGRGIINYAGHGRALSWVTTGFNRTSVDRLENDYKLPFILSVACQNGNFTDNPTCFAEAWLRATNDTTGVPTGGVAFYGSSVNQLWYPPLVAQTEATRLLTNELYTTIAGLWFNASARMINDRGAQGAAEFKNWNIFGDSSLQIRTEVPRLMTVVRAREVFIGETSYDISTNVPGALAAISYEGELLASGYTNNEGRISFHNVSFPLQRTAVTVTVTSNNYVTYIGDLDIIPNEGPYVVINSYRIRGEGPGESIEYGNRATLDITLKNVGIETAENVFTRLVTQDRYVTVVDSVRMYDDIEPDQSLNINNAFSVRIADNVPDKHTSLMTLQISDDSDGEWLWNISFKSNAPILQAGTAIIDDDEYGNGNGILEPGETAVITFPATNTGSAITQSVNVSLVKGSSLITVLDESSKNIQPIKVGETAFPSFTVTASAELPTGSIVPLGIAVTSGAYYAQKTYNIPIGAVEENFETGDFSLFDWSHEGDQPWMIDHTDSYQGVYSAKSGDIGSGESSILELTLEVTEPGFISFHRRISSAMGYHFLRFSINDNLKGQWSGDSNWTQVSYPVDVGQNSFKWEYRKDATPAQFYDSAWIDNIRLPTAGATFDGPIFHAYPTSLNYGTVNPGDTKEALFFIRNFGSEIMRGEIRLIEGFSIIEDEYVSMQAESRNEENPYLYVIPQESNIPVRLAFSPAEVRDYSGSITITSNAENQSEMLLAVNAEGGMVHADEETISPATTQLIGNYPNPFNPSTTITYSLEKEGQVSVEIFNIRGQKIKTLINEKKGAGRHSIIWDGTDGKGANVSSGIYFYLMKTDSYENARRMLYLK